jgi:long-chain acyl-CoA synthetase
VIAVPGAGGGAMLHVYLIPAQANERRATEGDSSSVGASSVVEGHEPATGALGAIVARCNGLLAQHQRIATASWWPDADFPRTSTLKVRRHLLPAPQRVEGAAGVVTVERALAADDPVGQAIAGAARVSAAPGDQTLAELGLDSLALTELVVALEEKTGKVVADGDLKGDMTVDQVRAFLAGAPVAVAAPPEGNGPLPEAVGAEQPLWPYTWGRAFRFLGAPFDLLYRLSVTRTVVLGREHLVDLPAPVIFAGTHHSFADVPLVRRGLEKSAARGLAQRLVVATYAGGFAAAGLLARYGSLAFGLYPLRQYGEQDASLRGLARLAQAGNALLIFPQGIHAEPERERAGDPSARFRPGVAHLAAALDAAVVPFGLAGTEQRMPPRLEEFDGPVIGGIPVAISRGPLAIAFGAPLRRGRDETPQAFAARLQAVSFALTREAEQALTGEGTT